MKTYVIVICFVCSLFQTVNSQQADERIGELINGSDWFTLEKEYPELKKQSQFLFLQYMTEAMLGYFFNQPDLAIASVDSLLKNHQAEIGFENSLNMLLMQNDLLRHKGEYKRVQEKMNEVIEVITPHVNPDEYPLVNHLMKVASCFQDEKSPLLTRPAGDIEIFCDFEQIYVDTVMAGYQMKIMAEINGTPRQFIVDTGAEKTFLLEQIARENQVRFLCDSMSVTGVVTSSTGYYGITDRLEVGGAVYENVVTIIIPPNEEVDTILRVDAILGKDFLSAMGEIIIYPQEQKIIFPEKLTPLPATGRNMLVESGLPWVEATSNGEKVIFQLDTGASTGGLNCNYFKKHEDEITAKSTKETRTTGGLGGLQKHDLYRLPEFPLQIGETSLLFENVGVQIEDFDAGMYTKDGVLGMDFILKCKKVIINFKDMFVIAEI